MGAATTERPGSTPFQCTPKLLSFRSFALLPRSIKPDRENATNVHGDVQSILSTSPLLFLRHPCSFPLAHTTPEPSLFVRSRSLSLSLFLPSSRFPSFHPCFTRTCAVRLTSRSVISADSRRFFACTHRRCNVVATCSLAQCRSNFSLDYYVFNGGSSSSLSSVVDRGDRTRNREYDGRGDGLGQVKDLHSNDTRANLTV